MRSEDRTGGPSDTDRVEVVADQTEDGAYELRVERHGAHGPAPHATAPLTRMSAEPGPEPAVAPSALPGRRIGLMVAVLVGAAGAIAGAALVSEPAAPPVVETAPVESFRAFRVEPRATLPSAILVDAGVPDLGATPSALGEVPVPPLEGVEPAQDEAVPLAQPPVGIDEATAARLRRLEVAAQAVAVDPIPSAEPGDPESEGEMDEGDPGAELGPGGEPFDEEGYDEFPEEELDEDGLPIDEEP